VAITNYLDDPNIQGYVEVKAHVNKDGNLVAGRVRDLKDPKEAKTEFSKEALLTLTELDQYEAMLKYFHGTYKELVC
jgi:hypothetical protein